MSAPSRPGAPDSRPAEAGSEGNGHAPVDDQPLGHFLGQLAARLPAPGAGAAAAMEAALAASLVAMVGRFTTGERYAEHADVVAEVVARADVERDASLAAAAADGEAFTAVTEAYRLPKGTEEEEEARRQAIGAAQERAAGPPRAVIASSASLMTLAERLLPIANFNVLSDVSAATEAARAAATTARLAIEVNLPGVRDEGYRDELAAVIRSVDDLIRRAAAVEAAVRDRITS